ncbi:hypothetical protein HanRHA438_Chr17g0818651 [Helianthus annuus]|nr:hypothetical protein HanRHA438_Chr17g0818651 [Helianthus annuus]
MSTLTLFQFYPISYVKPASSLDLYNCPPTKTTRLNCSYLMMRPSTALYFMVFGLWTLGFIFFKR